MALPLGLVIGSQTLSGVFGAFGQRSQRKEAERYAREVKKASLQDAALQMATLGRVSEQLTLQGAQQIKNIFRQGSLESGEIRTGAGAAGVGGAGIASLEQEFEKQTLTRFAAQEADTQIQLGNIRSQQSAVGAQAASRINQAYSQVPGKQNLFGTLLNIGSQALFTGASLGGIK